MATTVTFDSNGGPLTMDIHCGFAQDGSYFVKEWVANDAIQKWEGDFNDPTPDRYELPGAASDHDGHKLQLRAEVSIVPPIMQHLIVFSIFQDGQLLHAEPDAGQHTQAVLWPVGIWLKLEGE